MLTPGFFRKMAEKHQAAKAAEDTTDPSNEDSADCPNNAEPLSLPVERSIESSPSPMKARVQRAADTRVLNQYGRSRADIDDMLRKEYHEKGPTLLAQELGMKKTAVMMRARRMGLSADLALSVQRRVTTRQRHREAKKEE